MKPSKDDVNIICGRSIDDTLSWACVPLFLFSPHLMSSVTYLDTQQHGPDLEVCRWRGGGGECYVVVPLIIWSCSLLTLVLQHRVLVFKHQYFKKKLFKLGIFSVGNKI